MTVTHTREFIVLVYLPLGVFKNVIKSKKNWNAHKKQTEMSFCLFPIQLKWGGWTDDEVSFILKFCDSFCITARWSQDYFKLFWVEVLHYQSFFPGMIVPNWYYIFAQAFLVSLHGDVCVFHGLSWEAWHVL